VEEEDVEEEVLIDITVEGQGEEEEEGRHPQGGVGHATSARGEARHGIIMMTMLPVAEGRLLTKRGNY
jgi:hypothetical protein